MNTVKFLTLRMGPIVGVILLGITVVSVSPQSTTPRASALPTAEHEKQLDRLNQLDEQLQKDRDIMHQAIIQYGWDTDQVDSAQENLFRDREEYRKLRRSLRATGVTVPSPSGLVPAWVGNHARGVGADRKAIALIWLCPCVPR
jgi:hypothetical protein